jgi:O-antigen ligase
MSRFNNPKALTALDPLPGRPSPGEAMASAPSSFAPLPIDRKSGPDPAVPVAAAQEFPEEKPSPIHTACFVTLCLYLLSAYANEFSSRLLHTKAYISTVSIALLPLLFAATGGVFRSVQGPVGKWYLAFGGWLAVCAPFSSWKSNTLSVLFDFYLRSFLLYFVVCACVLRLRELKRLMLVLGIGAVVVLFTCFKYGRPDEWGRFAVPESGFSFFANSNELALQLLLGMLVLLFYVIRKGFWVRAFSLCLIAISFYYSLGTGSRGGFVAAAVTSVAFFLLTKHKLRLVLLASAAIPVVFLLVPSEARHRLFLIVGSDAEVANDAEGSAIASQRQREQLLRDSIRMTLTHPLFGAGPGDYTTANAKYLENQGLQAVWLNTHNTYTQVSSESGIPGFIFFVAAIIACIRMNYRVYKQTARIQGLEDYAAVSLCMLLSIVAFSVNAFFDQQAYTTHLPVLAGVSTATYLLARRALGGPPEIERADASAAKDDPRDTVRNTLAGAT